MTFIFFEETKVTVNALAIIRHQGFTDQFQPKARANFLIKCAVVV